MKKITIGADELILWLRKNKKAQGVPNDGAQGLGRKIYDVIIRLGGNKIADGVPAYWANDGNAQNIGQDNLPKGSAQYSIDTNKLGALYDELDTW
jgi:hypothetical protein